MPENFIERPRENEKDDAVQYVKSLLAQVREDNRNEDIEKLEELVRLLHTKKYGLVWEEHGNYKILHKFSVDIHSLGIPEYICAPRIPTVYTLYLTEFCDIGNICFF